MDIVYSPFCFSTSSSSVLIGSRKFQDHGLQPSTGNPHTEQSHEGKRGWDFPECNRCKTSWRAEGSLFHSHGVYTGAWEVRGLCCHRGNKHVSAITHSKGCYKILYTVSSVCAHWYWLAKHSRDHCVSGIERQCVLTFSKVHHWDLLETKK